MGIKAGSKRRGLRQRLAKQQGRHQNQVKSSSEAILVRLLHRLLESSRRRKFYPFRYLFLYSPLKFLENGTFVVASVERRAAFYGLTALYAAIICYRFQALLGYLIHNGLDVIGALSSIYVVGMFAAACLYYGILCAYEDMRQVLNEGHPQCMRQVCGYEDGMFSTLNFGLKRMSLFGILALIALDSSLFSLVFDSLPVCVYPAVKGMIRTLGMSTFVWQVLFYPMEVLSVAPPFIPAAISITALLIGVTQMKDYVDRLSKMAIVNFEDWKQVEREYRCALVYNNILIGLFRRMAPAGVVGLMVGLIGIAYVTVTSFGRLPFLIYVTCPVGFVSATGIFTLACMDAVNTKMSGNNVMGRLRLRGGFFISLSPEKKREFVLRCRALRPISLPIGNFTELSVNVPIYVFEEVLNQLLFLLSF